VGHEKRVYALSNKDPFSQANVMSRGIIGDLQGERVLHHRFTNNISV
jgi:nitrite reductase (NADH) large subunit